MATIKFEHINKVYPNKVQAVFDFNLDVKDKEFIVFVGPSGCGKSTTLRMVAGLEDITTGELFIDDALINEVVPMNRNIAMVFQNYALYPHMSVEKNIGFALKYRKKKVILHDKEGKEILAVDTKQIKVLESELRQLSKVEGHEEKIASLNKSIEFLQNNPCPKYQMVHYSRKEIKERVIETAKILGLEEYLKRKPKALSGGQRQRVALGRAIVRNPKVFLMDEPLSNLDAKLRVSMRSEITRIHKQVGATTIYVTHDQTEAMTMADRIVCMKDGYVQQIGTPEELYNHPANIFVGSFIGSPSMNFFNGTFDGKSFIVSSNEDDKNEVKFDLTKEQINALKEYKNKEVVLGIRPECFYMEQSSKHKNLSKPILVQCDICELLGNEYVLYGNLKGQKITIKVPVDNKVIAGEKYVFMIDLDRVVFFDKETTKNI